MSRTLLDKFKNIKYVKNVTLSSRCRKFRSIEYAPDILIILVSFLSHVPQKGLKQLWLQYESALNNAILVIDIEILENNVKSNHFQGLTLRYSLATRASVLRGQLETNLLLLLPELNGS